MASVLDPVGSWLEAVGKGLVFDYVVYSLAAILVVVGLFGVLGGTAVTIAKAAL